MMHEGSLLTLEEAASRLRVKSRWLQLSRAPRRRITARIVRFDPAELDRWSRGECAGCGEAVGQVNLVDGRWCPSCEPR